MEKSGNKRVENKRYASIIDYRWAYIIVKIDWTLEIED